MRSHNGLNVTPLDPPLFWLDNIFKGGNALNTLILLHITHFQLKYRTNSYRIVRLEGFVYRYYTIYISTNKPFFINTRFTYV
jgi:hypothetical protein